MAGIIDILVDPALRSVASHSWDPIGVVLNVGGLVKTLRISRPVENLDASRYVVWGVRTLDTAESQIRPILYRGDERKTIGFIFPIASFDPSSEYSASSLEEYQQIYASAAASLIVDEGAANDLARGSFEQLPDHITVLDLFDDDCAIIVIATRILGSVGGEVPHVKLALQEHGYFPCPPREKSGFRPYSSSELGLRKVSPLSSEVGGFVQEISEIVSVASRQASPAAAFIVYYQVIELFANERFKSEINRIASDPACSADSWLLRKKLAEAASERKRVNALFANCMKKGSSVVNQIEVVCKRMLAVMSHDDLDRLSAADAFYKVRNVLVHDQKAIPSSSYRDLSQLVDSLHLFIFILLRAFDPAFNPQPIVASVDSSVEEQWRRVSERLREARGWLERRIGESQQKWLETEVDRYEAELRLISKNIL